MDKMEVLLAVQVLLPLVVVELVLTVQLLVQLLLEPQTELPLVVAVAEAVQERQLASLVRVEVTAELQDHLLAGQQEAPVAAEADMLEELVVCRPTMLV